MPNPFDQFDEPGTTATATANPFDQFDQFDTAPQADPRAARRADLQAQQAAARSAGETTSFAARAAAGIEQGLRTPEVMVRGGLDALQYYRALDAVTGSGNRFQSQNEAELRAMRDRDAYLARETQAIEGRDGRNFVGDLVQGVARGVVELPPQLMAGAAGAMRGAAVQASAAMGGLQGGLSQYAQDRGEGRSQLEAYPPAVASGLITAVTTRFFGDTGIESVFRNEGVQGFRRRLLGVLKDAGMEGAEEFVDQAQQDLLERATRNPGKTLGESFYDTMQALAVGTVIGGAASAPRLIQRADRPVIVNEQTGTTDFPPLEGDELPPPPPPAPPAGPANVAPPIRGEAAMQTRPSAGWTPDGPRTPAVDPELAAAIAAVRAGYNPEVDAPAPAPAPPSTFNLQPLTFPEAPGVPTPLEGQPYEPGLLQRPEAAMETRRAAPLDLQREPAVSPELADAIAAVRAGYQPEVEAEQRAQGAATSMAAPSRFRPKQAVEFSRPLVGPSGASLVAYEWKWTPIEEVDKRGEERIRRISNWEEAQSSAETGRDIVHQFQVKLPDGTSRLVSAESVPVVLGFAQSGAGAKLPSIVSASKTLAQLQMKLALLEQQEASNTEAMAKAEALPLPPITSEPAVATVGKDAGKPYGTRFKMGTDSWVLQREPGPITAERLETLVRSWQDARAKEFGLARPSERRADLQNRIARQQKKLDAILQSQPTPPDQSGGPTDAAEPVPNLTAQERIELNELRMSKAQRGRLGRLNTERLADLEAKAGGVGNSAIDAAIAALDAAKIKTEGIYTLPDLGLTVTLWNGSLDAAKLALRTGRSLAQAVEAGINWLRTQGQRFDEARVRTALEQTVKADARIAATKARTVAGRTVGTSNPTTKRRSGEGTDPDHNVSLQRLRARNPEAYRKNALLLTRYPLVAREYPELAERMRAIDSPYEAAEERYENAKEKLEEAKGKVEKALAGLLERKANSIKAAEVEAWMRSDPNSRLTVAVRNAQELVATRKAQRDEAADRRSERIDALAESKRIFALEDADRVYETYIKVVESNLEALIKLASTTWRDTARLWYDGANLIAQDFARQFGATLEQASAVLAVFSPQKDWFMNVALARRMMNIWQNDQNTRWSPEMSRQFIKRSGEPQPVEDKETGQFVTSSKLVSEWNPDGIKYDKGARPGPPDADGNTTWLNWDNDKAAKNLAEARELLKDLEGRTLAELKDPDLQARFIRMLSEVRDNPNYPKVTPDGQFGELMRNENGKVLKIAWGGYNTIEKAIAVMGSRLELKSGDVLTSEADVISAALGAQHKVRSFYNNIVDPANTSGHVTMDTHAIAALLWMPLSGASPEVTQNFGGAGTMNAGELGIKGMYAANAEAYRRAAVAFSLLPREVQSITWEAVRMLFPAKWKADKTNVAKVRDLWEQYRRNELTIDQARNAVFQLVFGRDLAGAIADDSGVGSPSWTEAMGDSLPDSRFAQETNDARVVSEARGAWGPGSGRGAGSAGSVGGGGNPAAVVRPAAEGVVDSAIAALEAAKVKPGGLYSLPDLGLTVTLWNGTLSAAQLALRAGRSLAQSIQAGLDWLRAQGQQFDEAKVRAALEQALPPELAGRANALKQMANPGVSSRAKEFIAPQVPYTRESRAEWQRAAQSWMATFDNPQWAAAEYWQMRDRLPGPVWVALGLNIAQQLNALETAARAAGRTAEADALGTLNGDFRANFVQVSTDVARTLNAYGMMSVVEEMGPFAADVFAQRTIEQASQKQKQRLKPTLDAAKQQLDDLNRTGIEEAARTPEVQGTARTVINQAIEAEAERKDTAVQKAITLEVSNTLETLPSVVRKANAAVLGAWDKLAAGEQVRQQAGRAGQALENSLWSAIKQRGGAISTVSSVIAQVNRALHEQVNRTLGVTPQQFVNPTTYLMRLRDALGNAEVMSRIWEQTRAAVGANLAAIDEMERLLVRIEAEIAELEAEAKTPLAGGPEVTAKDAKLKAQQQAARDEMLKGRNANLADAIKQRRDRIADVTAQLAEYRKMQPAWQAVMGMTVDVWGPNLLRGLLREQMKADGFRLRKAVADHFRGLAGAPDPLQSLGVLRDKLIAASGLDPQAADRLAKDLEAEYTAEVNKERARLAERLAKARERRANLEEDAPRREAEALINGYQKAQTEWLKPEGQKSAIRQIIRQAMADQTAAKHRDEQAFRADLATRFEGVRVPPGAAARLAYEVWLAKQARDASAVAKKRAAGEKAEAERDQKSADALLDTWEREQTEWLRPSARQGVSAAVAKVLRTAGLTETQFQAAIQSAVGGFNVTSNTVGEIALAGWRKYQTLEANRRTKEAAKTRDKAVTDAESLIDAYDRRQTEWLKPTGRKSAVRAIVRQALREGASVAGLNEQVVRGGVQAQLEAVGVPHEAAYRLAYEVWQERQAKGGGIDAVVAARVKELQLDLGRIIRQHWTQVDNAGESLAEHIVGETQMPAEQAERLAAAIQRRFKALVQARKEKALRNLAKTPAARELQKPSVAQRIIEATNLGALDSEGLWQAVAEKLGLPTYTAEASAEVKRLAERAQQLPEGSVQRQEATARMMRFIARQKGINLGDLGWAFWYANTLSGPFTHAVNTFSNTLSLAANVATQLRDVRGIPQILVATAKGFRTGLTEARAIVKQGPGANRTKFTEQGQALENLDPQDFTGAGLVSQWRYVARALAAADAAFYFPAREAKAITLARALARQEGKTGAAIRTRAQQVIDGTEEQQNLWGAQVDRERAQLEAMGEQPDALWTTRRLEQLREQNWGADIGEAADDFALRTTYNNRPYGLVGALADVAKYAQRRVPGARAVVPFVNVVANVVNDSINYTPWGFARAYAASRTGEPSVTLSLPFEWAENLREGKSPMTPDAVVDLHAKAALGTVMVGSLMGLALAGLDDDDGENFQLYGAGPKDAAAKAALRETGWLPYSVRVNGTYLSFANTPLAIPLGALGHYLDAARYDKRFEQADAFNRLGVALWGGAHIITQQSFLDGLARLLGALEERRGRIDTASDRAVEQAFRSISSVAVPNALRQLDRLNDPKIYDTRGIEGALVAGIPFARRAGSPALNAFGEPITNEPWKRFASDAEANVWTDLARRKIYPSVADKAKNANGREMTDDEHYRYVQESGQAIKRRLETPGMRQMIRSGKEEDARKAVTAIVREERERTRRRLGF